MQFNWKSALAIGMFGVWLATGPVNGEQTDTSLLGFSKTKPETGHVVAVKDGFLVPYKAVIPGTEIAIEMVPVPGGKLLIGSPENEPGRKADEGPQVTIDIGPMWVGQNEIRWVEYQAYMNMYNIFKKLETSGLRKLSADRMIDAVTVPTPLYEPEFTYKLGNDPDLPAVTITQFSAKQFTKWLSKLTTHQYRLPTEAEWEYACRAGSTRAYAHGDDPAELDAYAWHAGNSDSLPHKVGMKKPNAWGLHDMHGNVMEWAIDGFSDKGYASLVGKPSPISFFDAVQWPTTPDQRIVRGGSWQDDPELLRCAARLGSADEDWKSDDPNIPLSPWWYTSDPARGVGFRLFRSYQPLSDAQIRRFWEIDHEDIEFDVNARMEEGRGVTGLVDPALSEFIKQAIEN